MWQLPQNGLNKFMEVWERENAFFVTKMIANSWWNLFSKIHETFLLHNVYFRNLFVIRLSCLQKTLQTKFNFSVRSKISRNSNFSPFIMWHYPQTLPPSSFLHHLDIHNFCRWTETQRLKKKTRFHFARWEAKWNARENRERERIVRRLWRYFSILLLHKRWLVLFKVIALLLFLFSRSKAVE